MMEAALNQRARFCRIESPRKAPIIERNLSKIFFQKGCRHANGQAAFGFVSQ